MRIYNGAPDSRAQALIDDNRWAHKQLNAFDARATYFPAEGQWMVFKDLKPITQFHDTLRAAANAALEKLR